MKRLITAFIIALPVFVFANPPEVVTSPVDHLFVPKGFDNNDNVEIVVTGKYPNPCYIRNTSEVEVKDDKIFINVTALRRDGGSECESMAVPFSEEITIGNLQAGKYEVIVNQATRHEQTEKLDVAISRSTGVDDHIYAIVDYVELGFTGGLSGDALLLARSPSDCVVFDHVEYLSNNKDTISILPIMKKISETCKEKTSRFEIPVKFDPRVLPYKDILLFVRSIEGKSVHSIINR